LDCGSARYIAAEFVTERSHVVREDLRIVCTARGGDVCHTAVEQVFRTEFGIYMDQNAVCGLALIRMAGHSIAVVEIQLPAGIESHGPAIVHLQMQLPIAADGFDDV
jgi:hypothetical protein